MYKMNTGNKKAPAGKLLSVRAHIRRCRKRFIFSFRRGSPGSVPFGM